MNQLALWLLAARSRKRSNVSPVTGQTKTSTLSFRNCTPSWMAPDACDIACVGTHANPMSYEGRSR
jgi:hypothetical protein